jgi:hypothetical protein
MAHGDSCRAIIRLNQIRITQLVETLRHIFKRLSGAFP